MALWWLERGWTDAQCGCGANIWKSGGDPDWGRCFPCMERAVKANKVGRSRNHRPLCAICRQHPAEADAAGVGVCSLACAHEAERRGGARDA